MYWSNGFRLAGFSAAYLFIAACSNLGSLPQSELKIYQDAIVETRAVGEETLRIWDSASRTFKTRLEQQRPQANPNAHPYPESFNARDLLKTNENPDAASVRLIALDTVVRYTDLIVTLAEGKNIEQVQNSAGVLRAKLETISRLLGLAPIPGLAATDSLIQLATSELEKARTRAEFRNALKNGENTVVKLLNFLIDDTTGTGDADGYYTTVFALKDERRLKLRRTITDAVGNISKIVGDHAAPTDPRLIPDTQQRISAVLKALDPPLDAPILVSNGRAPFSNLAHSQVLTLTAEIDAANTERMAVIASLRAYHKLLGQYVRLLDQSISSLSALRTALDRPQYARAHFENTLRLALTARRDIRLLREDN